MFHQAAKWFDVYQSHQTVRATAAAVGPGPFAAPGRMGARSMRATAATVGYGALRRERWGGINWGGDT